MNKILLLSDADELADGAFEFARMLNEQEPILLVGVFLPKVDYWNTVLYYSFGAASPWLYYTPGMEEALVSDEGPKKFRELCVKHGIEHRVHEVSNKSVQYDIKKESRFADLIVFSNKSFYEKFNEQYYNEYAEDTLHQAECPVVIIPESFRTPENIILSYDGSSSSVYAIRQFAALLPHLTNLDTLLVYVDPNEDEIPDLSYMEELGARHFNKLTFLYLDVDPKKYFGTWLTDRKNVMLVTGAQGRSGLSELFRRSFVSDILKEINIPIFIAHR